MVYNKLYDFCSCSYFLILNNRLVAAQETKLGYIYSGYLVSQYDNILTLCLFFWLITPRFLDVITCQ